jgi:hypothetical protein
MNEYSFRISKNCQECQEKLLRKKQGLIRKIFIQFQTVIYIEYLKLISLIPMVKKRKFYECSFMNTLRYLVINKVF